MGLSEMGGPAGRPRVVGFIPARMAASRFPGKPLHPILGVPMLEHVIRRSAMYEHWDYLTLATCDGEIRAFAEGMGFPCVMTGDHHVRALDRVAEAYELVASSDLLGGGPDDDDVVVCVQGDEPMMRPDMVDAVVAPLLADTGIPATVLAMHIVDEDIWRNPDTVKLISNQAGEVLYTSRAPIPHGREGFSEDLMARRIYGIFAFRWRHLRAFTEHAETRLELEESCDSNRILDMEFRQVIAPYPHLASFAVDSPEDVVLVEQHMIDDPVWGCY